MTRSSPLAAAALAAIPAALSIAPAGACAAPARLVSPQPGETVPLLADGQKAFLDLPREERIAAFADPVARAALAGVGHHPRPVRLEWAPDPSWEGLHPRYAVSVRRLPDGTPVFFAETAEPSVDVFNLEIARSYEWTVRPTVLGEAGTPATSFFRTEDRAPRLLRVPGVPNVRDFGGRTGLDGRRVRQGMVFRSSGLNENAAEGRFAREEVLARAADPDAMLAEEAALKADAMRERARLATAESLPWLDFPGDLRQWTVFRPTEEAFGRDGAAALADMASRRAVPESFCGACGEEARADENGRFEFPGETRETAMGPAVFVVAFDSAKSGLAKVGCGADWFWTLFCNGETVADHSDPDGNYRFPPSADNRVFPVPVAEGRNLIAAVVRAGGSGFVWCCAPKPGVPAAEVLAAKAENDERRARYLFHVAGGMEAGATRISAENRSIWLGSFGIRTDIDLRTEGECWGMDASPLGEGVNWVRVSSAAYQGLADDWGKAAFARVFRHFLDPASYPIDFHCIAGADRTGSLAFVLGALLGVEEEELWKDWECTAFWNPDMDFVHERRFAKLLAVFGAFPGETLRHRVEAWVRSCGFSDSDISAFRSVLLEPML